METRLPETMRRSSANASKRAGASRRKVAMGARSEEAVASSSLANRIDRQEPRTVGGRSTD